MHRRERTATAWAPAADSGVSLVSFLKANPSTAIRLPEKVLTSVSPIWRAKRAFRQGFILTTPSQGQEGVGHQLQQLRQKKGDSHAGGLARRAREMVMGGWVVFEPTVHGFAAGVSLDLFRFELSLGHT
jgi:hypothetical protein